MMLFAAVVREQGFTAAARALHLSKQTVSDRIARLEASLGVRLLSRTTRSLRPTPAGAEYYERCTEIAARVDDANRTIRQLQTEPMGTVRISVSKAYAVTVLPGVLRAFGAQHPKVRIEVDSSGRRVRLVEEGFDLAVRVGPLDDSSLTARSLGGGRRYYVASPRYLAQEGDPTVARLARTRIIGLSARETWQLGGKAIKVAPWLVVDDPRVACAAAVAGAGVARLPVLACGPELRAGQLRTVFNGCVADEMPVHVVYLRRQYLLPPVRLLIDALVARGLEDLAIAPQPVRRQMGDRR